MIQLPKMGHCAPKCPEPRRPRRQWNELHAHETIIHAPEYASSPEAIRDGIQYAANALMSNLMSVMTPIFDTDEENPLNEQDQQYHELENPDQNQQSVSDEEQHDQQMHAETTQLQLEDETESGETQLHDTMDDNDSTYTYTGMTLGS